MDKRFQVFVSSTYVDLKEARQKVIQTLLGMDCIPAGMELFPAADEEQWEFINRVIDDCDYYILIIGGRYGSITDEGISYTEKEYDYAISIGLKVLVFVREQPDDIPEEKSDIDPSLRDRLEQFRKKVSEDRIVRTWRNESELPGLVALSLSRTIKLHPAVGWVRANNIASNELLADLNNLRKENAELKAAASELESGFAPEDTDLASLDDSFVVHLKWTAYVHGDRRSRTEEANVTWKEIFGCIAPDLQEHPNDGVVNRKLGTLLYCKQHPDAEISVEVRHDDFQTIRVQLTTLGLIRTSYLETVRGGMALFWTLTKRGQRLMTQLRTVKASDKRELHSHDSSPTE